MHLFRLKITPVAGGRRMPVPALPGPCCRDAAFLACHLNSARCCVGSSRTGTCSSTPAVQGRQKLSDGFCSSPTASEQLCIHWVTLTCPRGTCLLVCFTHNLRQSLLLMASALLLWMENLSHGCKICSPSSGISGPTQSQNPSSITLLSLSPSPS